MKIKTSQRQDHLQAEFLERLLDDFPRPASSSLSMGVAQNWFESQHVIKGSLECAAHDSIEEGERKKTGDAFLLQFRPPPGYFLLKFGLPT